MNFEYKETIDKQRELVSLQKKVVSKSLVSALKVFLYIMCLAIVTGGFFGLGVIHGIIKSAPSVENISIVPIVIFNNSLLTPIISRLLSLSLPALTVLRLI